MAQMAHAGKSDAEIAEHVKVSAAQLGIDWETLRQEMKAATREEAVELVIAELIREARAALRAEQDKLALVIASPKGKAMLTLDYYGRITGYSPFAEKALGVTRTELVGQTIDSILESRQEGLEQSTDEMQRAEKGEHVEAIRTHRGAEGRIFEAEHCVIAIVGEGGVVTGFVRDIADVTQRRVHEIRIAELDATIALLVHK